MPVKSTERQEVVEYLHRCADRIERMVKKLQKAGDTKIPQKDIRNLQVQIAETTFALKYPESTKDEEE